jgi:hypothetical protein
MLVQLVILMGLRHGNNVILTNTVIAQFVEKVEKNRYGQRLFINQNVISGANGDMVLDVNK